MTVEIVSFTLRRYGETVMSAVMFDLDGVIRHFDPAFVADLEQRHGLARGELENFAFSPSVLTQVTTGKISRAEWIDQIGVHLKNSTIAQEWACQPAWVDNEVLDLVDQLRELGFLTAILTNGTDAIPAELAELGVDGHFDLVFNSAEIGYIKPDTRVFSYVLNTLNLDGTGVFFTDDSEVKLAGADAIGIKTHLYSGVIGLRSALQREGVDLSLALPN